MNIIKQLPDDLQDMIYSQLHKSYMKDLNIEIEQYEQKKMEKQRREDRRWVLFNIIALLYKRLLRTIYTDKIKFLDGYHWREKFDMFMGKPKNANIIIMLLI